jgi:transcriptional regulator with XRE-family HTH domain
MPTNADSLGSRIQGARSERGWSLAEVARRTGLSRAYINAIENGRSKRPGADAIRRLEEALGPLLVDHSHHALEVPPGLKSLAKSRSLSAGEVQILANLRVRGDQPQTEARWRFIYDALVASESLEDRPSRRRPRTRP